jgi:hypothetical protein
MSTKEDNYSFIVQSFTPSELRYYNSVNLNQSEDTLIPVQSNSKPNNDKNCEKEKFQSWDKSSKISTFATHNEENDDLKKRWKNENTLNTTNKSTPSLHIAAYENSNEAAASNLFGDKNIEGLQKEKYEPIKTSDSSKYRQIFVRPSQLCQKWWAPSQQNGDQKNEPEVMPFSASQRLLCSQPPTSSEQIGNNGEQYVQPQMSLGAPAGADTAVSFSLNKLMGKNGLSIFPHFFLLIFLSFPFFLIYFFSFFPARP